MAIPTGSLIKVSGPSVDGAIPVEAVTEVYVEQTALDGSDDANFRIKDDVFQLKDVTDGLYRTVWVQSGTLMIADTGEA